MSVVVEKSQIPELIPLHRLPDLIPSSRRGKKLALATIYRWSQRGRIPTVKIGGSRYVSASALAQILSVTADGTAARPESPNLAAKRAGAELDALLARRRR